MRGWSGLSFNQIKNDLFNIVSSVPFIFEMLFNLSFPVAVLLGEASIKKSDGTRDLNTPGLP